VGKVKVVVKREDELFLVAFRELASFIMAKREFSHR
jgi:hypothetical protein